MPLERRRAQDVAQSAETPSRHRAERGETPYTDWIAYLAKTCPEMKFSNLAYHFSVENLRQAFDSIDGSKAVGGDGVTKEEYGKDLENNLRGLNDKMRKMAYRPSAAKQVLIPKPDGNKRPIAISNFEDKLVQKVAANILTAIYDRGFKRFSFGFRPGRSPQGAVGYFYNKLRRYNLPWVVDVDLKNFFNTIDHKKLLEVLSYRIVDKTFLRYIYRMLRAGTLIEGDYYEGEGGTPQGSIVSPILANIYLHHVLDEWFNNAIRPGMKGEMVRYADDVRVAFALKEQAKAFVEILEERLREFGLSLNRDKTRIVYFDRNNRKESETFDFLGFTYYWGMKGKDHRVTLKVKTSMKTLRKKVQDFVHWIKANRSRYQLNALWESVARKLQGHYNYYGVLWNRAKLYHFYHLVIWNFFRWLNRRSQKTSYTWEGFKMRLEAKPLPLPTEGPNLIDLNNPGLYCCLT